MSKAANQSKHKKLLLRCFDLNLLITDKNPKLSIFRENFFRRLIKTHQRAEIIVIDLLFYNFSESELLNIFFFFFLLSRNI